MHIFYTPDIETNLELPEEEAKHCIKVLRLEIGEEVMLTDGKGAFYRAKVDVISGKKCTVCVLEKYNWIKPWKNHIHIALAPTKNMDRVEWFVEKAAEIGIDELTFLSCRYSERKVVKNDRIERILVSAIKQSKKANLPHLNGMVDFKTFILSVNCTRKFIAHCYDNNKQLLRDLINPGEDTIVLIGPEGDFSEDEVALALENGFVPISLGGSRLRTETAALVACHTINLFNQI